MSNGYRTNDRLTYVTLVFLTSLFAANSLALAELAPRYPWDTRSSSCLTESNSPSSECVLTSWPDFETTVQRVAFLYRTENFTLLERALAETVSSNIKFTSGRPASSAAYWAFRRLMPAPGVSPTEKDRVARWKAAIPNSYYAIFAEARFMYSNGWNVRGSGYAGSVSTESWELFAARLKDAESILLNAPAALKDTPLWHNLLFAISLDTDQVKSAPRTTFEQAVKLWPEYYDFYEVMLTRLVPKWGGSWEQVESFIEYWTKQRFSQEGDSLYARLYISVLNQGVTPNQTILNWDKMKRSFKDFIARYPDQTFKNLYASYACFAKDRAAFNDAMQALPKGLIAPDQWISGHSYEACLRWSVI
jgi:hypothetical protein